MKNNQYNVNVTDDLDIMNNHSYYNHIIQGRKSHNFRNENKNTKQKSIDNTDDTISVITDI